ncbi:MAG TPA: outer membrane lipoprotein-sorting protein [Gammaproteobacteria bacterium]|nr:outer membrane lipoprotein-sorting protein [Gammaproteobacteria bacterium]
MRNILLGLVLLAPSYIWAQTPEERGLEIATEADRRDTGWGDQKSDTRMVLHNRHGQKSERKMHNRSLEVVNDGDKSLIVFDYPRDVKGTAFLTYTHSTKPDDQWLYLPALKRVKRISSNNKSGPFMGSEFAYEDLSSQEIDKYTYKFIKEDKVEGRDVLVIERFPQYEHSGYKRQMVYMDKQMYQPLKVVFYDRKNALYKTLFLKKYHQYLNQYWRAGVMQMVNHQTGKSTDLIWKKIKFRNGFTSKDFRKNSLKRAR